MGNCNLASTQSIPWGACAGMLQIHTLPCRVLTNLLYHIIIQQTEPAKDFYNTWKKVSLDQNT